MLDVVIMLSCDGMVFTVEYALLR
uniref:Uncharacterized protein n=1 Tax=Rhizophora mucronata TaxID=61149 RepID=A0A2P2NSV2_RHIMU